MMGKGATLKEMMAEREGVTKVVGPSGEEDPQDQSRRRPDTNKAVLKNYYYGPLSMGPVPH